MSVELAAVPAAKRSGPEIHTQPVEVTMVQQDLSSNSKVMNSLHYGKLFLVPALSINNQGDC